MLKQLIKSIREYKKDTILTPLFMSVEVLAQAHGFISTFPDGYDTMLDMVSYKLPTAILAFI